MKSTEEQYRDFDPSILVGRQIVDTNTKEGTLTLDDGTIIEFETEITDCCSYLSLTDLHTTTSIITAAGIKDDEDEDSLDSHYNAWSTPSPTAEKKPSSKPKETP